MIGQKSKTLLFSEITVPLTNSCCTSIFSRDPVQSSQTVKTGTITLEQKKAFESTSSDWLTRIQAASYLESYVITTIICDMPKYNLEKQTLLFHNFYFFNNWKKKAAYRYCHGLPYNLGYSTLSLILQLKKSYPNKRKILKYHCAGKIQLG